MASLLGFQYYFQNGSSDITLISLASSKPNTMDSAFSVPKQIQPLERLTRIKKTLGIDFKILSFSTPFPLFQYSSDYRLNKDVLKTRIEEIDNFINQVAQLSGINLSKAIFVFSGEACSYGIFLYLENKNLYRNIIEINPYYEFYMELSNVLQYPGSYAKYFSIFSGDHNFNDPKLFRKAGFLNNLNLFIYSQGERYKFVKNMPSTVINAQNKIIELLQMGGQAKLARSFYVHFKREEKPKDYKTNIALFMRKYFFSGSGYVDLDSSLRKDLLIAKPPQ